MVSKVGMVTVQTLVIFQLNKSRHSQGFTLLEMVVVLVLMGVVSALVMPSVSRFYGSIQTATERDKTVFLLSQLSSVVRHHRKAITFDGYPSENTPSFVSDHFSELELVIAVNTPIYISATGFCPSGGVVQVSNSKHTYELSLSSPACRVIP